MISEYYFALLITNSFLLHFCQNLRSKNNPNGEKYSHVDFRLTLKSEKNQLSHTKFTDLKMDAGLLKEFFSAFLVHYCCFVFFSERSADFLLVENFRSKRFLKLLSSKILQILPA